MSERLAQPPTELVPLSDEQRDVIDLCRRFAADVLRPHARAVDEEDNAHPGADTSWQVWRAATESGIAAFMLPREYGGGGVTDVFTQCLAVEELAVGDLGLANLVTSNGFFADPVLELGTPEQCRRWLEPLGAPDAPQTAVAVTEPGVGSDAASLTTRADRIPGGYRLTGQKAWISNGGVARTYVVFATVEPGTRSRGITAFVLDRDAPGLSFGPPMKKMGQRAIVNTEVFLDGVEVAEDDRLGGEGQGFRGLMRTFDISRTVLGAAAVGCARAAYETAAEYARQRTQFGAPIVEHQAVGFRLADMLTRIDAARLLVWRAARRLDSGADATVASAQAKLAASEAAVLCTWAAVQTLGGWGYSREFLVEKWMRDAKLEEIEEGTSDIQRLVVARAIARDGA
ncbi:MAG: acyl-CoA dehydrogenase family protein [Candidatus Nanopelagicales bacterium]